MKHKILMLFAALSMTFVAVAQDVQMEQAQADVAEVAATVNNEQVWDEANTAYINANYPRAVELYHSIEEQGLAYRYGLHHRRYGRRHRHRRSTHRG